MKVSSIDFKFTGTLNNKLDHNNNNILCLTIDVEPDFGGLLASDYYYGKDHLHKLKDIVEKYDLALTVFVTGKTLEDNPDIYDLLASMNAEVQQHSYSHQVGHESKLSDIKKGIEIHEELIGVKPIGYRAPQGIITKDEAVYLSKEGIKYDSSIFPAFFPGRFNRLNFPTEPFIIKDTEILEIPFSVIPKIRTPIGLSYIQLLGLDTFKALFKLFGIPPLIIFDFHSYELGKVKSYDSLSLPMKAGYYRAQKMYNDPFDVLEKFIHYLREKEYESRYMFDIYKEKINNSPVWDWNLK